MNGRKAIARLNARRAAWDEAKTEAAKMHEDRGGSYVKRPGSMKKPFPAGKGKTHG